MSDLYRRHGIAAASLVLPKASSFNHFSPNATLASHTLDMSMPNYSNATDASKSHNSSAQTHVIENNDPALDRTHEHDHSHMHHDRHAEQGRSDAVVHSEGTTLEGSAIPHQDLRDHDLVRRYNNPSKRSTDFMDAEKSATSPERSDEAGPRIHILSNFYVRYRIFFHLFTWLFFTGYIILISNN